ncbi:hypothetical protein [Kiloniella sp. b19]|uniref:hypothetical protein n=1 Tax=Kiloniella sp. GXU_MW_B19 TaxID=3141326 RepID=UPI0031DCDC0F
MERGLGADLIRDEVSKEHRLSGPSDRVREKATRAWFAGWEKLEREKPWLLRPPVSDVPSGGDEALARAMWMKE